MSLFDKILMFLAAAWLVDRGAETISYLRVRRRRSERIKSQGGDWIDAMRRDRDETT